MAGPQASLARHAVCGAGEPLPGERPGPMAGGQPSFPHWRWDPGLLQTGWSSKKGAPPSGFHPNTLGYRPGLQARLFSIPQTPGSSRRGPSWSLTGSEDRLLSLPVSLRG